MTPEMRTFKFKTETNADIWLQEGKKKQSEDKLLTYMEDKGCR